MLNWNQTTEAGWSIVKAFGHGLRLDISMVCYLSVIPLLLWCLSQYIPQQRFLNRVLKTYNAFILLLVVLISLADGELYQHWGQKINAYASSFAKFPKEMLVFSASGSTFKFIIIILCFFLFAYFLYTKGMKGLDEINNKVPKWQPVLATVFLLSFLFLGIRGGIGKAAINQSSAFYSPNIYLNHTAVNATWNLMASIVDTPEETDHNAYAFVENKEAKAILKTLTFESSRFPKLFNQQTPNIVLVILEGWTADVIEPLGGEKNVTPYFNTLSKEGLLFTNFYANGNRTDKGLAAIISSQPALAHSSIINNIQKFTSLPSIPSELKQLKYNTSFYYGGASEFANMKGYWLNAGYDDIIDLAAFPLNKQHAEWGVHDDVLFDKVLEGLNGTPSPFFSSVLTLSSHEPFKVPFTSEFKGSGDDDLYRNAVKFSDQALGMFFEKVKQESWYQNTVFIILADHGHQWPLDRKAYDPERFKIPFLLVGGALAPQYRGAVNPTIAGQVDLASMLLSQLGLNVSAFNWSKNFMDTAYKPFATFTYNDGIGIIKSNTKIVFDQESKQVIWKDGDSLLWQKAEQEARAYEQLYFEEYKNR